MLEETAVFIFFYDGLPTACSRRDEQIFDHSTVDLQYVLDSIKSISNLRTLIGDDLSATTFPHIKPHRRICFVCRVKKRPICKPW